MSLSDLYRASFEVARSEARYPRPLRDLRDAPDWVRVVGTLPDFALAVAIVGTRRADEDAMGFAYELAGDFARRGWAVVSGGARGIDRAAHEGALDAGGVTVVVLPTGVADAYPRDHHPLFRRVITDGCLLTEVPEGTPLQRGRFLSRNRLIAALGRSTIVVQAPARSGALSTARLARRLGRSVLAVPASPWDPRGSGCLALLRSGSRVCAGVGDVLSIAPFEGVAPCAERQSRHKNGKDLEGLNTVEQQILQALAGRAKHPDELSRHTGIAIPEVQRSMLKLVLEGLVEERPGGRYRQRRRGKGSKAS